MVRVLTLGSLLVAAAALAAPCSAVKLRAGVGNSTEEEWLRHSMLLIERLMRKEVTEQLAKMGCQCSEQSFATVLKQNQTGALPVTAAEAVERLFTAGLVEPLATTAKPPLFTVTVRSRPAPSTAEFSPVLGKFSRDGDIVQQVEAVLAKERSPDFWNTPQPLSDLRGVFLESIILKMKNYVEMSHCRGLSRDSSGLCATGSGSTAPPKLLAQYIASCLTSPALENALLAETASRMADRHVHGSDLWEGFVWGREVLPVGDDTSVELVRKFDVSNNLNHGQHVEEKSGKPYAFQLFAGHAFSDATVMSKARNFSKTHGLIRWDHSARWGECENSTRPATAKCVDPKQKYSDSEITKMWIANEGLNCHGDEPHTWFQKVEGRYRSAEGQRYFENEGNQLFLSPGKISRAAHREWRQKLASFARHAVENYHYLVRDVLDTVLEGILIVGLWDRDNVVSDWGHRLRYDRTVFDNSTDVTLTELKSKPRLGTGKNPLSHPWFKIPNDNTHSHGTKAYEPVEDYDHKEFMESTTVDGETSGDESLGGSGAEDVPRTKHEFHAKKGNESDDEEEREEITMGKMRTELVDPEIPNYHTVRLVQVPASERRQELTYDALSILQQNFTNLFKLIAGADDGARRIWRPIFHWKPVSPTEEHQHRWRLYQSDEPNADPQPRFLADNTVGSWFSDNKENPTADAQRVFWVALFQKLTELKNSGVVGRRSFFRAAILEDLLGIVTGELDGEGKSWVQNGNGYVEEALAARQEEHDKSTGAASDKDENTNEQAAGGQEVGEHCAAAVTRSTRTPVDVLLTVHRGNFV